MEQPVPVRVLTAVAAAFALATAGLAVSGCEVGPTPAAYPPPSAAPAPARGEAAAVPGNWRALLIAGDTISPVFNNAVDQMSAHLTAAGLPEANIRVVRSGTSLGDASLKSEEMGEGFRFLQSSGAGGCLLFITAHGSEEGLAINMAGGYGVLTPSLLEREVDRACGDKPAVVITSGCYSGVYAREMAVRPDRVILTAARPDRTSFGCEVAGYLNVFDSCLLAAMGGDPTWGEVAREARRCVAAEERRRDVSPPSDPQSRLGAGLAGARLSSMR